MTWRLLLVVNPTAAGVNAGVRKGIEQALSAYDLTVAETADRDHATDLARAAAAQGMDAVVVLGGDGTLNEAANGLIGTDTALAALPGGSTSVYARTVGMSRRPVKAADQLCALMATGGPERGAEGPSGPSEREAHGPLRRVGTGSVNGRHFLFHLGVGYDAAVVGRVEGYAHLKRRLGQSVFIYASFATWLRHFERGWDRFRVEFDDGGAVPEGYFCICLNTNPYTYLGPKPLDVAPEATAQNGLVVVTLRSLGAGTLLGVTSRALSRKRHVNEHRKVAYRAEQRKVTIVGEGAVPHQVDGDYLGEADRLEVAHHPDSLLLLAPPVSPAPR